MGEPRSIKDEVYDILEPFTTSKLGLDEKVRKLFDRFSIERKPTKKVMSKLIFGLEQYGQKISSEKLFSDIASAARQLTAERDKLREALGNVRTIVDREKKRYDQSMTPYPPDLRTLVDVIDQALQGG